MITTFPFEHKDGTLQVEASIFPVDAFTDPDHRHTPSAAVLAVYSDDGRVAMVPSDIPAGIYARMRRAAIQEGLLLLAPGGVIPEPEVHAEASQ